MDSTKRQGEEPSSPPQSKRLHAEGSGKRGCIVFSHSDYKGGVEQNVQYAICIFDLDSGCCGDDDEDAWIPITPTLRYMAEFGKWPLRNTFCVLGETLFMFEGNNRVDNTHRKSVYSFDLSPLLVGSTSRTLDLDKTKMVKIGEMGSVKSDPVVIPTPDSRKIVVLPSNDFPFPRCSTIEVYDLVSGTWEHLPPLEPPKFEWCTIQAYGFIDDSTLLIQLEETGMYVLDLAVSEKQWLHRDFIYCDARRIPSVYGASNFVVIEDRFCFSTTGAFDLQEFSSDEGYDQRSCSGAFAWPFVQLPTQFGPHPYHPVDVQYPCHRVNDEILLVDGMVAFLSYDQQGGKVDYCQLRTEVMKIPYSGYRFIVDVCRSELSAYMVDYNEKRSSMPRHVSVTGKWMPTKILKSYKFSLDLGQQDRLLSPPHSFFCF